MQPPPHSFTGLPLKPIPLPTYSDPCLHKEGPGTVTPMQPPPRAADGRTSLLRRDQELLLQCSPPRTALHRPTLIQYARDWHTATILGHPCDRDPAKQWMHPPACLAHGAPVELVIGTRCPTPGLGLWSRGTRDKASSAITSPAAHGSDPGAPPQGERGTRDKPRRLSPPPHHSVKILLLRPRSTRDKASSAITSPAAHG
jgi:hypothetical protein